LVTARSSTAARPSTGVGSNASTNRTSGARRRVRRTRARHDVGQVEPNRLVRHLVATRELRHVGDERGQLLELLGQVADERPAVVGGGASAWGRRPTWPAARCWCAGS
jgi:hypothetical protein